MSKALTRIIERGHELLRENLQPGDLAVDLTAGNGFDTIQLTHLVGVTGQVVAFDVQEQAMEKTSQRLLEAGCEARRHFQPVEPLPRRPGVDLLLAGHEDLGRLVPHQMAGLIANLGYLPGGDQQLTTRPITTLSALEQASALLKPGGRLVVVVYVGHPGGQEEGETVSRFFARLDEGDFQSLRVDVINRPLAPYLLAAEKLK